MAGLVACGYRQAARLFVDHCGFVLGSLLSLDFLSVPDRLSPNSFVIVRKGLAVNMARFLCRSLRFFLEHSALRRLLSFTRVTFLKPLNVVFSDSFATLKRCFRFLRSFLNDSISRSLRLLFLVPLLWCPVSPKLLVSGRRPVSPNLSLPILYMIVAIALIFLSTPPMSTSSSVASSSLSKSAHFALWPFDSFPSLYIRCRPLFILSRTLLSFIWFLEVPVTVGLFQDRLLRLTKLPCALNQIHDR